MIIAVDFDGTIHDGQWPRIGEAMPGAREAINALRAEGHYMLDNYRDTVNEGIAMVKTYIESQARDDASRALVKAILRLLSRDEAGNLKASRVLQLQKMAEETGDERFIEGVRIIQESYQPTPSKDYIRAAVRDESGAWVPIPLSMTDV